MDQCENSIEMEEWWTELEKLMSMNVDQKQEMEKAITTHLLTKNDFLSEIRDNYNKNGILHYVAIIDSAHVTNFCISKNCDVNLLNNDENPPLAVAVECNNLETVKALIEAGAIHNHFYFKNFKGPLHIAAENKHVDMTKYLINIGANVNAYTNVPQEEQTPLHIVCSNEKMEYESQCMEVVKALVEGGADVNAKDYRGRTPLFSAIKNGYDNVTELLLNVGASCSITDDEGQLPFENIKSDDVNFEIIKRFIASESESDRKLWKGRTGLHYALAIVLPKTVKCMLENGASVDIFDFRHLDPLSFAFYFNRKWIYSADNDIEKCLECITLLLNHGFDLNRTNKYGLTPFYYALQNGCDEEIVSFLLDRGATFEFDHSVVQTAIRGNRDPKVSKALLKHMIAHDLRDSNGEPLDFESLNLDRELRIFCANLKIGSNDEVPLIYSNESAQPKVSWWTELEALISRAYKKKQNTGKAIIGHLMTWKDSLPEIRDSKGNGVLHYTSKIDSVFVANFCITFGCNVNSLNDYGYPPLAVAVKFNSLETVKALIEAGAIHDNYCFESCRGLLDIAIVHEHVDMVKYLISIGANVNTYYMFEKTPLHNTCLVEKMDNNQCVEIIKALIDAGADVNAKNSIGCTPLFYAVLRGFDDAIELLLNAGALVDVTNFTGKSPLHYIGKRTISAQSIKRLIEAGIDVNLADNFGHTAVYSTAVSTSTMVLKTLLDHGAKVDVFDHRDLDPLSYILRYNKRYKNNDYLQCVKLLLDHGVNLNRVNQDGFTPFYAALLNKSPVEIVALLLARGTIIDLNNVAVQKTMRKCKDPLVPHLLIKYVTLHDSEKQNDESSNVDLKIFSKEQLNVYLNCKVELNFMKIIYFANSSISYFDCLTDKSVRARLTKQQIKDMLEKNLVQTILLNYGELLIERLAEGSREYTVLT